MFLSDWVHKRVFTSLEKFGTLILFLLTVKLVEEETQDLSVFPTLTFDDVGHYAKERSAYSSTSKAYKFMAEPGYFHDIKGSIN